MEMNIGLIGIGAIGGIHAEILQYYQNDFVLRATADPMSGGIEGVRHYGDYRFMLADDTMGAVAIATPPGAHYEIALDALESGKHVLLEKPPTLAVLESQELLRIANRQNQTLFFAFHSRYRNEVLRLKQILCGDVQEIMIDYCEQVTKYHDAHEWIFDPAVSGGGALMDSGINAISIIASLLPDAELRVEHVSLSSAGDIRVETKAEVEFAFGTYGKGRLSMDWMCPDKEKRAITLRTAADEYALDLVRGACFKNGTPLLDQGKSANMSSADNMRDEYRAAYADFARCIAQGRHHASTRELRFVLTCYDIVRH